MGILKCPTVPIRLDRPLKRWWTISATKIQPKYLFASLSIDYLEVIVIRNYHILTHWGQVTHICVGNLTIIGSDNGLSPGRRQTITWTKVGILLIGPLGTNFSEMLIEIHTFSFKKIHLKMSSGKWRPFCLGLECCYDYVRSISLLHSLDTQSSSLCCCLTDTLRNNDVVLVWLRQNDVVLVL